MRTLRTLAPLLALGCVLVGCIHPQQRAGEIGVTVGKRAPEVEGRDANGLQVKLSGLRGKVVLLDFWQSA
jgi:AhpC/TSA family